MGILFPFIPRAASQDGSSHTGNGPATIIIFPGVRYEREEQSTKPAARPQTDEKAGNATG